MPGERDKSFRLFVACPVPEEVLHGLAGVQQDLRRAGFERLRYVRPEGIHITLKFLGAVPATRVDAIKRALGDAIEPFEARLETDYIGVFGGQRARVFWAGLSGDIKPLSFVAARVESALAPLGFAREDRPFRPHLTLARVPDDASPNDRRALNAFVKAYTFPRQPPMIIRDALLMQSIPGPGGSKYTHLASFPIQGPNA